jgi:cytochrome c-type biogenesis protein CcmH
MFWIIVALLCLAAVLFGIWPIWKSQKRMTPMLAGIVVFTVALSAALYTHVGSPNLSSGRATGDSLPDMAAAMASLQERLRENPDDLKGWKMLARTNMSLQQFDEAVMAYEKAMELEDSRNAQTMVDLALALLSRDQTPIEGRSAALIDSALALEPNNPAALFYSGAAAAERGDTDLAASRWEILLGLNPPPEIQTLLEQRIAEWRGAPVERDEPAMAGELPPDHPAVTAAADEPPAAVDPDAVVTARLALSQDAIRSITSDANVFLIARDPAQPSPPIAVSRLRVSELPKVVSLSDAQSMVAGRSLSGFEEFELLARVSLSGGLAAASGDWFGSLIVRPADGNSVSLSIDQQVP